MVCFVRVALVSLLLAAACDSSEATPTADELDGLWVNVDAGTVRAFDFASSTRTYQLYLYADGSPPEVNQSGTYQVASGRLVTNVVSAKDPAIANKSFGNDILGFNGSSFTLESDSAANGKRVFTRTDALP